MDFNNSILDAYANHAKKQFDDMQHRLTEMESSFQTRMSGKSMGGLVVSLLGTIAWLAAICLCAAYAYALGMADAVDHTLLIVAAVSVGGLMLFMILSNIVDFSYYGKIASYGRSVAHLQNRVSVGRNAILSNQNDLMASKKKGWEYPFHAAPSIPEETLVVEGKLAGVESLKKGFLNDAKNLFFGTTAIALTLAGGAALFPLGNSFITEWSAELIGITVPSDRLLFFDLLALIAACAAEGMLAKWVWSATDCSVTNLTLVFLLPGPLFFLAFTAIGTVVVSLAIGIIDLVKYAIYCIFICAVVFGMSSGA